MTIDDVLDRIRVVQSNLKGDGKVVVTTEGKAILEGCMMALGTLDTWIKTNLIKENLAKTTH